MTEERGVDPQTEETILAAVEALDDEDAALDAEGRAYLEALGLLAYETEEVPPKATVERSLLARIEHRAAVVPLAAAETATPPARPFWMLRVAAVVAVVVLGVAALQFIELGRQRDQIGQQATRIAELRQKVAELSERAEAVPTWLTSSGTELCELEPRVAAAGGSKGWLFVRADHQHWYVSLEGLAPAPQDHVYELWFRVEGERLVSGGTFHPDASGRAVLASPTMPTGVSGIAITLEPANGDDVPSEEMILYGDEVMLTL